MREIIFRAKAKETGKWIYGDLMRYAGTWQIWHETNDGTWNAIVDTDTVGQYTGLADKNGTRIFEGDIVFIFSEDENGLIRWDEDTARFLISADGWCADFDNYYPYEIEVIGNIHDNPELLGGAE